MNLQDEPPIHKLPSECIGAIFQRLDHEDAQKFRRVHPFINETFKKERNSIAGPICNVNFEIENKNVNLIIRSIDNSGKRQVALKDWRMVFKNAECQHLEIETDEEISMDLLDQILIAKSIRNIRYFGKTITKEILKRLNDAAGCRLEVTVDKWIPGMAGTRKLGRIDILNPIESLEDIVEAMKTVPDVYVEISWPTLVVSANSLERLRHVELISEWHFNIHGNIGPFSKDLISREFDSMIRSYFQDVFISSVEWENGMTLTVLMIANLFDVMTLD